MTEYKESTRTSRASHRGKEQGKKISKRQTYDGTILMNDNSDNNYRHTFVKFSLLIK